MLSLQVIALPERQRGVAVVKNYLVSKFYVSQTAPIPLADAVSTLATLSEKSSSFALDDFLAHVKKIVELTAEDLEGIVVVAAVALPLSRSECDIS